MIIELSAVRSCTAVRRKSRTVPASRMPRCGRAPRRAWRRGNGDDSTSGMLQVCDSDRLGNNREPFFVPFIGARYYYADSLGQSKDSVRRLQLQRVLAEGDECLGGLVSAL